MRLRSFTRARSPSLLLALAPAALGQRRQVDARADDHRRRPGGGVPVPAGSARASPTRCAGDLAAPKPGRERRRVSLAYFGQISDFQLADEESPARVEFLDPDPSGTASSAWRPQEALQVHQVDRVDPRDEPLPVEPVAAGRRHARADGERRDDGRPRRQHAAQRDRVGRASCSRAARSTRTAAPPTSPEAPARRARRSTTPRPTPACRTTTTTPGRLPSTTPTPRPASTRTGPRTRA